MLNYSNINHEFRRAVKVSANEFIFCDMVYYLSRKLKNPHPGWCWMTKQNMAKDLDLSKRGIEKIIQRMIENGFIEKDEKTKFLRATELWEIGYEDDWKSHIEEIYIHVEKNSIANKVRTDSEQSSPNIQSYTEIGLLTKVNNPSTDTSVNARNMKITYSADDKTAPANQSVNQLPAARSRAGEAGTGAKNIISRTGLTPGQKRTIDKINEVGLDFYEMGCKLWKTKGFRFACQLQELRIQIHGYIDATGTGMSAVEILEGMCSNAGKVKWLEAGFGPSGISHSFDQVRVAWERSLPKPAEKSKSFSKTDYNNLYENSLFSNQTMQ